MKTKINDSILIRKVRIDDAKQYIELINLVWRDAYKNIFPKEVFIDREREKENRIKSFANKFHNDNNKLCYVAERNGAEALKLLLDFGFNYLNLNNIMLVVKSFNERAIL